MTHEHGAVSPKRPFSSPCIIIIIMIIFASSLVAVVDAQDLSFPPRPKIGEEYSISYTWSSGGKDYHVGVGYYVSANIYLYLPLMEDVELEWAGTWKHNKTIVHNMTLDVNRLVYINWTDFTIHNYTLYSFKFLSSIGTNRTDILNIKQGMQFFESYNTTPEITDETPLSLALGFYDYNETMFAAAGGVEIVLGVSVTFFVTTFYYYWECVCGGVNNEPLSSFEVAFLQIATGIILSVFLIRKYRRGGMHHE